MRKCPHCQKIIQKLKGCDHLRCICGYEFCFYCSDNWTHTHICEAKIPHRTGLPFLLCFAFKVLLGIVLALILALIFLFFCFSICLLSGLFLGFILFARLLDWIGKCTDSDCAKCILLMGSMMFLPLLAILCVVPGCLLPIVNICWQQKIFL